MIVKTMQRLLQVIVGIVKIILALKLASFLDRKKIADHHLTYSRFSNSTVLNVTCNCVCLQVLVFGSCMCVLYSAKIEGNFELQVVFGQK